MSTNLMVLDFPFGRRMIWGGPWDDRKDCQFTNTPVTVKLEERRNGKSDIDFFIQDYGVPDDEYTRRMLAQMIRELHGNTDMYVGCWGGMGRTGLVLGLLAKIARFSNSRWYEVSRWSLFDPVKYVREYYRPEAVETTQQERFVRGLDVKPLIQMARHMYPILD